MKLTSEQAIELYGEVEIDGKIAKHLDDIDGDHHRWAYEKDVIFSFENDTYKYRLMVPLTESSGGFDDVNFGDHECVKVKKVTKTIEVWEKI